MNKTSNVLLVMILVLLVLNLGMTTILVSKLPGNNETSERLDPEIARDWGNKVVELYNQRDHPALYRLFNRQAQVKISEQQLADQLEKLHQLFGDIEDHAYVNAIKLGEKGGERYYQLFFNARVSENNRSATLKLSLILSNDEVSLYGLSVNASESLE